MTPLQQEIFDVLTDFDEFCRTHQLEYFLDYGTLLGAVRSHAFIPWDDDIDLAMDSKNFDRLRSLAAEGKLPATLRFEDTHYTKSCSIPKICRTTSTLKEKNGGVGLFIDIFPLRRYTYREMRWMAVAQAALLFRNRRKSIHNPIKKFLFRLVTVWPHLFYIIVRAVMRLRQESMHNGTYLGQSPATTADIFFPVSAVFPLSKENFEGRLFPVPKDTDKVLTIMYGSDWRTPRQWADADHYADTAGQ